MGRLLAGIDRQRAAVATGRPPTISGTLPPALEAPVKDRVEQAVAGPGGRAGVAARRVAVGRAGGAGDRQPARLADRRRHDARARRRAARASPASCGTRATPTRCCWAWAARRSGPRSSAARSATCRPGLRLQVLDSTHPDAVLAVQDSDRHRQDDLHRLLEVRRHGRDALPLPPLQGACRSPSSSSSSPIPGSPLEDLARADGLRRVFRNPQRHRRALLGAVVLRPGAGGAGRGRRRRAAARLPGRRGGVRALRLERVELRPVARRGDRRARAPGPRQADVHRRRPGGRELRPVGRAAGRRVDRQARPRDPAGRRRAGRRARRVRR